MRKYVVLLLFQLKYFMVTAQSPSTLWSSGFGLNGGDRAMAMTTDAAGNIYTTGSCSGIVDCDPGPGVYNIGSNGDQSIFVIKQNAAGNVIWAVNTDGGGSSAGSEGRCIKLDAWGNIYITGIFTGIVDFDPGPGVNFISTTFINSDIFVWKLTNNGNLIWAKGMGNTAMDIGNSIALDAQGNCYFSGNFRLDVDFDPGPGVFNLNEFGVLVHGDAFVCKLDSGGNFVWAKKWGSATYDDATSLQLDANSNVYLTGYFYGTVDFDPDTTSIYNATSLGFSDSYLLKLDSSGNFVWVKTFGCSLNDYPTSMVLDTSGIGSFYISGIFRDVMDINPGPGVYNLACNSPNECIYMLKLDLAGDFIWAKVIGGNVGSCRSSIITTDLNENLYCTGGFAGTVDFNPDSIEEYNLTSASNGFIDIFMMKLDSSGSFKWASSYGGEYDDTGLSVGVDDNGKLYFGGEFNSDTLTIGASSFVNVGFTGFASDAFITRFGSCSAHFTLYSDTIPHNWIALNQSSGVAPLTYQWNWGDSTYSTGATPSHTYADSGYYTICVNITDAEGCMSNYCDTSAYLYRSTGALVNVSVISLPVTSMLSFENSNEEIYIYPNPVNNSFQIKSDVSFSRLEIFNCTGIKCYQKEDGFEKAEVLDVSFLLDGLYYLKLFGENKISILKMIKK